MPERSYGPDKQNAHIAHAIIIVLNVPMGLFLVVLFIDWEFVTSVFKIRKNSFYRITIVTAKFSNSHISYSSRSHWGNRWMGTVGSDDPGLRFWQWGRQWSCRRFVDFVISCTWSCWTVDELTHLALLTSQLSAVFATKNLLELGGDECDNVNFMNSKHWQF